MENILRELYDYIAQDNGETITCGDLISYGLKTGHPLTHEQATMLLETFSDKKELSFADFLAGMCDDKSADMSQAELELAFELFNPDDNGHVTINEFAHGLILCGEKLNYRQVINLFIDIDLKHDGVIDFEEFKAAIK